MKKRSKSVKSAKSPKKQPFKKRDSSVALGVIVALTVFNLVYSYAIGIPLTRIVVESYVESVYSLGDAQERAYMAMGAAIVAGFSGPARSNLASVGAVSEPLADAAASVPAPEPLLLIAPNQISIAK